ncbi:ubiquitin-activating enzyme [Histoplasma capsulatum G186AR]|uniref:Ubiquitin-activating enzyme E1-like n=2 Tax=Ajellomyces capsulatus TaxID=5037 RepID=C0NRQ1_AJECG|nr:ubiquitin-activating enzyme [Histoplasma capsulatum G186AR]EEH05567.1 ubiquitin-activating enzyme [Histoplasma capsulatum G186AR]KAG5298733.1 ubiquitin-activating enzyme [Histoplasma capsulatum]QSS67076.1 ubiquitin-activating enzyme [Histoplasma capsulatum G186AR]
MDKLQRQPLGSLLTKIRKSRVFLVGAGGIGCELLKNLVLTGFGEIHIIDLDTIDLSNLNRQFLFRQEHIKKPKALVAKEVARKFRRDVSLHAYHADIKDPQFNVEFFESFDIVFNALDNLDARRHVNRMCLTADVPLIESGTTGFNGQVQVIKKGRTECYDCNAKQVPKSFPVCTIRSTPSQSIHCIVWAKSYLLPELFGESESDPGEFDHSEDAENAEEIQNLQREAQALLSIRQSMGSDGFGEKVFTKVFNEDVDRLRKMEDMWKTRKPPQPLSFDPLQQEATAVDSTISSDDQKIWSLVENFAVFKDSLGRLSRRLQELEAAVTDGYKPVIAFDKDDVDTLDFVTASANLRSYIFGIEMKSKFEIKQMAGNIIPAIATTNAMTAAICVLQAFKVLKDEYGKAKMVFLERSGVRAINTANLSSPNPQCPVCSVAQGRVSIDLERATLDDLVQDVLRGQLGYGEELSINNQMGTIYDPDLDDNLPKKLKDLGVSNDSFLTVVDEEDENTRVNLDLLVSERPSTDPTTQPISLPSKPDIPRKLQLDMDLNTNGATSTTNGNGTGKRKRDADENPDDKEDKPTKRLATMSVADGDGDLAEKPIILEDDSGTILIDED